ncbi:MAG: sigma 54-interacting transcriptional regulator [Alicyclobacillus herbarius]|uniref:sigma-54 interaction domain-containing protein n=1 Tax=Alicyclobacillus herbarius TaxID=122960 RepID=UPI0023570E2C|nr:sigma 54-interacting transcriptional regulator [Alicyclobacillus herbarius]MCL6633750.1 sigma 54-interacting transcriptional regulator [Alicyclobacillus herbarius]
MEPVAVSEEMQSLFKTVRRVAAFPTTVLIEGETGSGKEVVADYLHQHSPRRNLPFIKVNCASIPEQLFESELFGYERGAFTGAKREGHSGLFELAHEGTLLLDEVGELSPTLQAKLLRVLQDREIRRVGGSWSKAIDVRVVASTNRDLRSLVEVGRFREDLYYRLDVVHLRVPPLRARREDIIPLCHAFLAEFCHAYGFTRRLSGAALQALEAYTWPGNVRQLRNVMERLCVTVETEWIDREDVLTVLPELPPDASAERMDERIEVVSIEGGENAALVSASGSGVGRGTQPYSVAIAAAEKRILQEALASASSIRQAAAALQLSHSTLLRKMARHGLSARSSQVR